MFIDDPASTDPRNIGVRQRNLHAVFAAYLRYQHHLHLGGILEGMNDQLMRLFWRALTFGGQGGSDWSGSRAGGRNSLLTLCRLLQLPPQRVPQLWSRSFIENRVNATEDTDLLRRLARERNSRQRVRDVNFWRDKAKQEISIGLGTARYFQAMKLAAIAEAFLLCDWNGNRIPLNPY